MKHTPKYKETVFGWRWGCSCGAKVGYPPFVRKEHAVDCWQRHQASAKEVER